MSTAKDNPEPTSKPTKRASTRTKSSSGFTAEERAAMKERAREVKAEQRAQKNRADGEHDVQEKIAAMPEPDRALAQRVHEIVTENAPDLMPRTWYGMPAYARDGQVVCFFQGAAKFDSRYATLGFNDAAQLDEGSMWATSFAVTAMTPAEEARIAGLVRKAVG